MAKSWTDKQGREWFELDPEAMSPEFQAEYEALRELNRQAAIKRERVIELGQAEMGNVAFGFNFGKLSFSEDAYEAPKVKKASGKGAMTPDEWRALKARTEKRLGLV